MCPHSDCNLINMLEGCLSELTSGFYQKLVAYNYNLTPMEYKVCFFVKRGLSCKEIAPINGVSWTTVQNHKRNIRRKLGLSKKAINLNIYLNSLEPNNLSVN